MEITGRVSRSIHVRSADQSEVGNARRQALALGSAMDFTELRCGELAIVVTEVAKNLATHGGGGELILTAWKLDGVAGVDVLALDHGAGIPDVAQALRDGYSTAGTPGNGLGAIGRLAQLLEVYSPPGKGTAVLARLFASEEMHLRSLPRFGAVVVPISGETVSGDAWAARWDGGRSVYLMADGLGHGPSASEAGQQAIQAFRANAHLAPRQILLAVHAALVKTRGAAVAVAEVLHDRQTATYIGVGNIASALSYGARTRNLVSMNGTAGHNMGTIQEFTYPFEEDTLLLMHSDGLFTRWQLADYPGLAKRHPALVAGVLYRDFTRRRDDAAMLVVGVAP